MSQRTGAGAGRRRQRDCTRPTAESWIKARVGFVSEDMALYGAATLGRRLIKVSATLQSTP